MDAFAAQDFEYEKVEKYVEEHFDYIDTHSSDRVIDWFVLNQIPEEFREALRKRQEEANYVSRLVFSKSKVEASD